MIVKYDSLDSMCELIVDCPHSTPKWTKVGIVVLRNQNIRNGVLDLSNPSFTNQEDYEKRIKRAIPQAGDIVFTREAPMGEVCLIPEGLKCCLGQRQVLLRPKKDVSAKYLFWALQSPYVQHQISWNEGTGTTVSNVRIPVLKALQIPRQPKYEIEIANKLTVLATKLDLNHKTNQTLERMAQALFKSWFIDFDPVLDNALAAGNPIPEPLQTKAERRQQVQQQPDFSPLPADIRALFPSEFEQTDEPSVGIAGWVPKGWELLKLEDGFNVVMGQSPPGSTYNEEMIGIPFFQGRADFGFRFPKNRVYCTEPKRYANGGDTLVSVRAPVGDSNMAATQCAIGRGVAAIRHISGAASYTYYYVQNLSLLFEQYEGEGTVFGSINQKALKSLPFLFSSEEIIRKFELFCRPFDKKIELMIRNILELEELRDTLLPKLISGEISLDQVTVE